MAATATRSRRVIQLTAIDADWLLSDLNLAETKIESIEFDPGASGDILILKEGADSGPVIAKLHSTGGEVVTKYFKGPHDVLVDFSACTLNAGHSVTIIMGYR